MTNKKSIKALPIFLDELEAIEIKETACNKSLSDLNNQKCCLLRELAKQHSEFKVGDLVHHADSDLKLIVTDVKAFQDYYSTRPWFYYRLARVKKDGSRVNTPYKSGRQFRGNSLQAVES